MGRGRLQHYRKHVRRVIDICDLCIVWSREFRERTSGTAHRGSTEPTAGRTPDADCYHPWQLVRADEFDQLPRANERKRKEVQFEKFHGSCTKVRDLRRTLIQYLLQQNHFRTGEDKMIEKEEDVRRHAGGMSLLTDLSLAMRTDPLALIRGTAEIVTVIYGPAVKFAFPHVRVQAIRRSVLHLNLISAVDGSALNWCKQNELGELMSEDLLFARISEPEMTSISFDEPFRDQMGEVERGHVEVFPKL